MAETLNKRLQRRLDEESRANAQRYWAHKVANAPRVRIVEFAPKRAASSLTEQPVIVSDVQQSKTHPRKK